MYIFVRACMYLMLYYVINDRPPPFSSPARFVAFKTVFNTPVVLYNNMAFTDDDIIIY